MIKLERPNCPNQSALDSGNYKHVDNKLALKDACCDKCMYCESKISHTYFGDIEHIKPKDKFPTLEFDWNNLGYVCAKCNNAKLNKYDDTTPFVNPYDEEPSEHIVAVGAFIKHKHGSERGEITITDIKLNRIELLERRKEKMETIEKVMDRCFRTSNETLKNNALEALKDEAKNNKEYSLCIKGLFLAHGV